MTEPAILNSEVDSKATRINLLHSELAGYMTIAVKKAIEIGRLLTEQKAALAHGEWIPWVESNLLFGRSQAANYMRIYRERDTLNVHPVAHLKEAVALLAELKEAEPDASESETTEQLVVYQPDPEQEAKLKAADDRMKETEKRLKDLDIELRGVSKDLKTANEELSELRKLKADKERVEKTLKEIEKLQERKKALFSDAESTQLILDVLRRSRDFFTRECMQIPALNLRPESVKAMQQDFRGLTDLVENWLDAIKARFIL